MNNKLTIALALFAGLAGGLVTRYIAPPPVFAQAPGTQTSAPQELRARSFTLVDASGNTVVKFAVGPRNFDMPTGQPIGPVRIILKDANGRVIWSAGGSTVRPLVANSN
jgi:hypothetical protein